MTLLATEYRKPFQPSHHASRVIPSAPECNEDFLSWRPMSYCAHFAENATSSNRDVAIAASEVADPKDRNEIDARHLSMIVLATCDALRNELSPQTLGILAETTAPWARPLAARGGAVINSEVKHTVAPSGAAPQGTVGALFDREIEQAFRA